MAKVNLFSILLTDWRDQGIQPTGRAAGFGECSSSSSDPKQPSSAFLQAPQPNPVVQFLSVYAKFGGQLRG